jgi:hypothetical protein
MKQTNETCDPGLYAPSSHQDGHSSLVMGTRRDRHNITPHHIASRAIITPHHSSPRAHGPHHNINKAKQSKAIYAGPTDPTTTSTKQSKAKQFMPGPIKSLNQRHQFAPLRLRSQSHYRVSSPYKQKKKPSNTTLSPVHITKTPSLQKIRRPSPTTPARLPIPHIPHIPPIPPIPIPTPIPGRTLTPPLVRGGSPPRRWRRAPTPGSGCGCGCLPFSGRGDIAVSSPGRRGRGPGVLPTLSLSGWRHRAVPAPPCWRRRRRASSFPLWWRGDRAAVGAGGPPLLCWRAGIASPSGGYRAAVRSSSPPRVGGYRAARRPSPSLLRRRRAVPAGPLRRRRARITSRPRSRSAPRIRGAPPRRARRVRSRRPGVVASRSRS